MAFVGLDLQANLFVDTFPAFFSRTLLAFSTFLPFSVSYYRVPLLADPSIKDMIKLADDISIIDAKTKQMRTQSCEQANRQKKNIKK